MFFTSLFKIDWFVLRVLFRFTTLSYKLTFTLCYFYMHVRHTASTAYCRILFHGFSSPVVWKNNHFSDSLQQKVGEYCHSIKSWSVSTGYSASVKIETEYTAINDNDSVEWPYSPTRWISLHNTIHSSFVKHCPQAMIILWLQLIFQYEAP